MTNKQKLDAVMWWLKDEERSQWSDGYIARQCGVSRSYVGKVRREYEQDRILTVRTGEPFVPFVSRMPERGM